MTGPRRPVLAVVGGGMAGLAAAWELAGGRQPSVGCAGPIVHVLEASALLGGKLRSVGLAGRTVDLGADAFLGRRPEAVDLCRAIGAGDQLVPVGASGASLFTRGRLRPMPSGQAVGVPTRWLPLARSGVLNPQELLVVAGDLVRNRRRPVQEAQGPTGTTGDRAVGEIIAQRLGRAVVEQLADPLLGGIHAGGIDSLSAEATFPLLLAASRQPGSLMRALSRAHAGPAGQPSLPAFWSLRGSTADLVVRLAAALTARGVNLHTDAPVAAVTQAPGGGPGAPRWRVSFTGARLASDEFLDVDGIVLAVPAPQAASLMTTLSPSAARALGAIEQASVSVVTLVVPAGSIGHRLVGTGFLVPRTASINGHPALMTGCTYLSRKWPHLARPGEELIRISLGRHRDERVAALDDTTLVATAMDELACILRICGRPTTFHLQRWDQAFPQYQVDHLLRVAEIEAAVAGLPAIAMAGNAYHGIGIPACIASGTGAARSVRQYLAPMFAGSGG